MSTQERMLALSQRLSCMDWPDIELIPYVTGPDSLLELIVLLATPQGQYYADVWLLKRMMYHNLEAGTVESLDVYTWRDELLRRGDITILPLAENCYGGIHLILTIRDRWRFYRWRNRNVIPKAIRREVYDRDGHKCVTCGATERLTLDHIIPWSRGGDDTVENLQTMCQTCNSRKGNRVDV